MTKEERTDLGTIMFEGVEFCRLAHFYPEDDWFRVIDYWGQTGWCVGYRDFQRSTQIFRNKTTEINERSNQGLGGDVYVKYDHDGNVGLINLCMIEKI